MGTPAAVSRKIGYRRTLTCGNTDSSDFSLRGKSNPRNTPERQAPSPVILMDQSGRSGVPDLPRGHRGKRVAARHRPV